MDSIPKQLKQFGTVKINAPLAKFCTFKIGGPAWYFITVTETQKLVDLLSFLSGRGIAYLILGSGANILFSDEGFHGAVIHIALDQFKVEGTSLIVDSGVSLKKAVDTSVGHALSGFEWAAGIPGTVGGAIRGNAGARYAYAGGEMKDAVVSVTVWRDGEVIELDKEECGFGYRDSNFKHNHDVILSAQFKLYSGNPLDSLATIQKIIEERQTKQSSSPSAGSFFKNVPLANWKLDMSLLPERFIQYKKIAAGWLIEQVGLKGFRSGDAVVSAEHGNFIINVGQATQADVLKVVEEVVGRVYTTFKVELEPEVQIIN